MVPGSRIPTAAELSKPGALQTYLEASLKRDGRCVLPRGDIRLSETLEIPKSCGGGIYGAGAAHTTHDDRSGWNSVFNGTRLIYEGDDAAIRWRPTKHFTLCDVSIEAPEAMGIHYVYERGWGASANSVEGCALHRCVVGFAAGEAESDHNAAEVTFDGVRFDRCAIGLLVRHHQGVNYHLLGCDFNFCDTAVRCLNGGLVSIRDCYGYATKTYLRIDRAGMNVSPYIIDGLACDRRSKDGHPMPVIVDCRRVRHNCYVSARNIKVTADWGEEGKPLFQLPAEIHNARCVIETSGVCTAAGAAKEPIAMRV